MTSRFEKNCTLFQFKNPRAAALLSCVDAERYRPCTTTKDEPNLAFDEGYVHAQEGAFLEANAWVESLDLANNDVLTIFGLGLGYGYYALQEWLHQNPKRQLIFLEDDLALLQHFLESELAVSLLCDRQVHLYFIEDSHEGLEVLRAISWAVFGKRMELVAMPFYQKMRSAVFHEIQARLLYEASDIHTVLDEYLAYGIPYFRNFWKNLFLLPGSFLGNKLHNAFKGVPAIVVAAGPSLAKQFDLLKTLGDKALIFSGGSSTNSLVEAGIMPHFGAGIDPNPLQYMRLRQGINFALPFFYRTRLLHDALRLVSGPRLYLRGGDGYNISDYFEKKAKISGRVLGGGHSVANFNIEIAHALGCSPIILVGYDLAYGQNLERYAPGIEENHPSNVGYAKQESDVVFWNDHKGNPIQTAWKWVLEGKWIEEFTASHTKKRFINATEGGLGINGIKHMTLEEAANRHLTHTYDLQGLVHAAIYDAGTCNVKAKTLLEGMAEMFDSLSRVVEQIDVLTSCITNARGMKEPKHPLDSFEGIMAKEALENEPAYQFILEVFDRMKTKLDFYEMQFALHATHTDDERLRYEIDLLGYHYFFLKEVSVANLFIIVKTVLEEQVKGIDISSFQPENKNWAEYGR